MHRYCFLLSKRAKFPVSPPMSWNRATKRQMANVGADLWAATVAGRGFWSPSGGGTHAFTPHSSVQTPDARERGNPGWIPNRVELRFSRNAPVRRHLKRWFE